MTHSSYEMQQVGFAINTVTRKLNCLTWQLVGTNLDIECAVLIFNVGWDAVVVPSHVLVCLIVVRWGLQSRVLAHISQVGLASSPLGPMLHIEADAPTQCCSHVCPVSSVQPRFSSLACPGPRAWTSLQRARAK